jgi:hypothetical protein
MISEKVLRHRENTYRWRERNREQYLEQHRKHSKDWEQRNPEKKKEADKLFREANPEKVKGYVRKANRKYYEAHKEQEKARSKAWRLANPEKYKVWAEKNKEKRRAASRKFEYNLLPEEFEAKFKEQDGKCPICLAPLENPDVDHDHSCCPQRKTCGKCTRGLLCHGCNTALGLFNESEEILQRAIQYVNQYKKEQ